jgi:hypothetical protein
MRVFYDTEFVDDGLTIDFISIGMAAEDGRTYYAVSSEMNMGAITRRRWLMENVVPHLPLAGAGIYPPIPDSAPWGYFELDSKQACVKPKFVIANEVRDFLHATDDLELWAWYGAYDHVALAQLWGAMVALPCGIPMYTNDIKQLHRQLGSPELPEQTGGVHNALSDAVHNLGRFQRMERMIQGGARLAP